MEIESKRTKVRNSSKELMSATTMVVLVDLVWRDSGLYIGSDILSYTSSHPLARDLSLSALFKSDSEL